MLEFSNLIYFAIPIFITSMLLKFFSTTKQKSKTCEIKDAFTSITMD